MDYSSLHTKYLNSGALAKLIFESTYDALFTITPEGIITSWNKGAEKIYGYSEPEIVNQQAEILVPSDRINEYRKLITELASGKKIEGFETKRISKFGTLVDVIYSASPIYDQNTLVGFAIYHRDITLQKKTEREFFDLCEQASDGITIADLNGRFTYANAAACKMLGYTREELVGKTIVDLIPPQDIGRYDRAKQQLMRPGEVRIEECQARKKDGNYLPVEVSAKILPDGRWQAFLRDLSAIKRAEKRFTHIFESAPDAEILVDSNDVIQLANEQCERTFGYSRNELIGQKMEILIPDRYKSGYVAKREEVVLKEESMRVGSGRQLRGRKKDGTEFEADILISPLQMDNQITLLAVVRDLTEIRKRADYARNIGDSSDNLKYYH